MAKAQISAEFLIILSIGLIIFFVTLSLADKREGQINFLRARLYAKAEVDRLANGINSVYILGDGAVKNISLSSTLKDGTSYAMVIYPQSRVTAINYSVQGKNRLATSTLITSNVTGNITNINANVKLINNNGVVLIEK